MTVVDVVEIRCPLGPRRLFTKLRLEAQPFVYVDGNLIEFPCADCRRRDADDVDVFHRYNFVGELVQTLRVLRT